MQHYQLDHKTTRRASLRNAVRSIHSPQQELDAPTRRHRSDCPIATQPSVNPRNESKQRTTCSSHHTTTISSCGGDDAPTFDPSLSNKVSTRSGSSISSTSSNNSSPALLLVDADLWGKFHEHQNEMILTKSGRCLFPCLRFKAVNLVQDALYSIRLDFERLGSRRFRFCGGTWVETSPKSQEDDQGDQEWGRPSITSRESYTHPDLYQTGKKWMQRPISFANVKLSNRVPEPDNSLNRCGLKDDDMRGSSHLFHMISFAKYRPRVHLVQRSVQSHEISFSASYTFERTSFVAVTHYQNHGVNDLKKAYNPHAKGFRDTIGIGSTVTPRKRMRLFRHSQELSKEHRPKRPRSGSVSTESGKDDSETDVRYKDPVDSNSEWLFMSRCVSGEVMSRGDKSAMVTISLGKNASSAINPPKVVQEHPTKEPLTIASSISGVQKRRAVESSALCPSETSGTSCVRDSILQGICNHQVISSEQASGNTVLVPSDEWDSQSSSPSARDTELIHVQEMFSGGSPKHIIRQLGHTGPFIDAAPASLFHIPNSQSSSPSFGLYTSSAPDHISPAVHQLDIGMASQPNFTAPAFTFTEPASKPPTSWYQQFLTADQPHQKDTPAKSTSQSLGMCVQYPASATLQMSFGISMEQTEPELTTSDRVPINISHRSLMLSKPFMDTESIVQGSNVPNVSSPPKSQPIVPSFEIPPSPTDAGGLEQLLNYVDPRALRPTSTGLSSASVSSFSLYSPYPTEFQFDQAFRENLCLKAFIRERYGKEGCKCCSVYLRAAQSRLYTHPMFVGQEAEDDANAVVAMEYRKLLQKE